MSGRLCYANYKDSFSQTSVSVINFESVLVCNKKAAREGSGEMMNIFNFRRYAFLSAHGP